MLDFDFSEKDLGIVSQPNLRMIFQQKMLDSAPLITYSKR